MAFKNVEMVLKDVEMAFKDVEIKQIVIWRITPVAIALGTVWYYRRKGVTFKSMKQRFVAFLVAKFMAMFNKRTDIIKMKDTLFSGLQDQKASMHKPLNILEIGAGGGTNFKFYPRGSHVLCLDPNPNFEGYLLESVKSSGVEMNGFIKGFAEDMNNVDENSMDAVVCSMVLCSVRDLEKSLAEVKRVLKSGGKFYFIEHVAASRGTFLYRVQRWLNPMWYCLTGDCQINKETGRAIDSAGFNKTSLQYLTLKTKMFIIKPFLFGTATK